MDSLTLFGLAAVTAMLLCYAFESRAPWVTFAFALSCAATSLYGFLQGPLSAGCPIALARRNLKPAPLRMKAPPSLLSG